MNAETTKIKDIYLEVLKPVVDKLYNMKVFYSREVARVISSDILSALICLLLHVFNCLVFTAVMKHDSKSTTCTSREIRGGK